MNSIITNLLEDFLIELVHGGGETFSEKGDDGVTDTADSIFDDRLIFRCEISQNIVHDRLFCTLARELGDG